MATEKQIVLSASRRTDIPAFYLDWFMERIERGYFEVPNPYNRKVYTVSAAVEKVHTIAFWSKDFGPFLRNRVGEKLLQKGFHLFFNFTLNSEVPLLEPRVPPLADRLQQLEEMSRRFDPQVIHWRFDPICFFRLDNGELRDNLAHLDLISDTAARAGVKRCITSFVDLYTKVRHRIAQLPGVTFEDPKPRRKIQLLTKIEQLLQRKSIELLLCCEKELFDKLPAASSIGQGSCIPSELLMRVYGGSLALRKDGGQRLKQGCGCRVSADIGSYADHPCHHNCLFCYANPS